MNMNKYIVKISTLVAVAMMPLATNAQQTLTLEQAIALLMRVYDNPNVA